MGDDAGDLEQTFNWLEVCAEVKDPGTMWGLVTPFFDEAKKDPRRSNLVRVSRNGPLVGFG
jgi:hypothetical protein